MDKKCCALLAITFLVTGSFAALVRAEAEAPVPGVLDQLALEVKPPVRFADYVPAFRVVKHELVFHWWRDGGLAEHREMVDLVMDGDRPIAMLPGYFFAPYPGADTRNWLDETFNPRFRRFGVDIPDRSPGVTGSRSHEVLATGRSLVFTARTGAFRDDPRAQRGAGSLTTFTLRVDPVWGYVIDRHTKWRADQRPVDRQGRPTPTFHAGMWYSGGITSIWPEEITYRFSGAAHDMPAEGDGPRFTIWSNNSESMFRPHHPTVHPRGFVANLRDRTGWGVALTHEFDQPSRYSVCPIWGGFHPHVPMIADEAEDGSISGEFHQRLMTLPPEIVDHIIDNARQVNDQGRVILIRPDGEDFEDQPLPAGTPERGFQPDRTHGIDTGQNCRITTRHARGGERSLEVDGMTAEQFINFRFFPRDRAHTRFLPNKLYRLECWVKVEGDDTEAFIIPSPALGLTPQRLLDGEGIGTHRTQTVRAGEGWRKVSVEFRGQPHGNPMNVRFVVIGEGKGYFDDFRIHRVTDQAEVRGSE
ncbi:MAG: hypothetical protein JJU36_06885 [Phycisphaeraceae bacterium]|nr:hypothetical protein [Phycisphaeraceae bacterium]